MGLVEGILAIIFGTVAFWGKWKDTFGLAGFIGLIVIVLLILTIIIAATVYVYVSGM